MHNILLNRKICTKCKSVHFETTKYCKICKEDARKRAAISTPKAREERRLKQKKYRETHKEKIREGKIRYREKQRLLKEQGLVPEHNEDKRYSRLVRLLFTATASDER